MGAVAVSVRAGVVLNRCSSELLTNGNPRAAHEAAVVLALLESREVSVGIQQY